MRLIITIQRHFLIMIYLTTFICLTLYNKGAYFKKFSIYLCYAKGTHAVTITVVTGGLAMKMKMKKNKQQQQQQQQQKKTPKNLLM